MRGVTRTWGLRDMVLTSWCDMLQQMREDMASGSFGAMSSYTVSTSGGSRSVSYRSVDEWRKAWDFVQSQCAAESGAAPYVGRYRAGNGGR